MQSWSKLGLVFCANNQFDFMHSHASMPMVAQIYGDIVKIIFSSRDKNNVSSICSLLLNMKTFKVEKLSDKPVLSAGELGCFDDSGVLACSFLHDGEEQRLYYIGWNLGVTVPFRNSIGVAVSLDNGVNFNRKYTGPILDRTKDEPHFVASTCVIKDDGIYKAWYLSCTGWEAMQTGQSRHHYHIKYAESKDGFNWHRQGKVAIDFKDQYEYAISVPRVIKEDGVYKMWFSSRGSRHEPTYRIRYATSSDGIHWQRKADDIVLNVSEGGWDSDMVCYPYIYDYGGKRFMLYNGNGYGKSGFGIAVLD